MAQAAAQNWPTGQQPLAKPLKLTVVYYYDGVGLDTDNMIKPIQDALVGLIYDDDSRVMDVEAHKRDLNGSYKVRGMSVELAKGFYSNREFVHIRVEDAQNPENLV